MSSDAFPTRVAEYSFSPSILCVTDSGRTFYMTYDRQAFSIYTPITSTVHMGTDAKAPISGIASVPLKFRIGNSIHDVTLNHVLHISSLRCQIISVNKITSLGVSVSFSDQQCKFSFRDTPVRPTTLHAHLYCPNTAPSSLSLLPVSHNDSAHIASLNI